MGASCFNIDWLRSVRVAGLVCLCAVGGQALAANTSNTVVSFDKPPTTGPALLHSLVEHLIKWDEASALRGEAVLVPTNNPGAAPALHRFWSWNRCAFDVRWLPHEDARVFCVKSEFQQHDVIHAKWAANGFHVEVSQTATLFLMKLIPTNVTQLPRTREAKLQSAKEICLSVFPKQGQRHTYQGVPVRVDRLNELVCQSCLSGRNVHASSNDEVLISWPDSMKDLGLNTTNTPAKRLEDDKPENQAWADTFASWDYWFRCVRCWTDGKSTVFFFPKKPYGPLIFPEGTYPLGLDACWFEVEGDSRR